MVVGNTVSGRVVRDFGGGAVQHIRLLDIDVVGIHAGNDCHVAQLRTRLRPFSKAQDVSGSRCGIRYVRVPIGLRGPTRCFPGVCEPGPRFPAPRNIVIDTTNREYLGIDAADVGYGRLRHRRNAAPSLMEANFPRGIAWVVFWSPVIGRLGGRGIAIAWIGSRVITGINWLIVITGIIVGRRVRAGVRGYGNGIADRAVIIRWGIGCAIPTSTASVATAAH